MTVAAGPTEIAGAHYELQAYIGAGRVFPSPFEGWATFSQIYVRRPDNCRFAVARQVPLRVSAASEAIVTTGPYADGPFLVWDLQSTSITVGQRHKTRLRPPSPRWWGDNLDGLIMKAIALFDRD
jgi:hypothetical protein